MEIINTAFQISELYDANSGRYSLKIENNSEYTLIIYHIPIPPKRKVFVFRMLKPNESFIFDWGFDFPIDLSRLYWRFTK